MTEKVISEVSQGQLMSVQGAGEASEAVVLCHDGGVPSLIPALVGAENDGLVEGGGRSREDLRSPSEESVAKSVRESYMPAPLLIRRAPNEYELAAPGLDLLRSFKEPVRIVGLWGPGDRARANMAACLLSANNVQNDDAPRQLTSEGSCAQIWRVPLGQGATNLDSTTPLFCISVYESATFRDELFQQFMLGICGLILYCVEVDKIESDSLITLAAAVSSPLFIGSNRAGVSGILGGRHGEEADRSLAVTAPALMCCYSASLGEESVGLRCEPTDVLNDRNRPVTRVKTSEGGDLLGLDASTTALSLLLGRCFPAKISTTERRTIPELLAADPSVVEKLLDLCECKFILGSSLELTGPMVTALMECLVGITHTGSGVLYETSPAATLLSGMMCTRALEDALNTYDTALQAHIANRYDLDDVVLLDLHDCAVMTACEEFRSKATGCQRHKHWVEFLQKMRAARRYLIQSYNDTSSSVYLNLLTSIYDEKVASSRASTGEGGAIDDRKVIVPATTWRDVYDAFEGVAKGPTAYRCLAEFMRRRLLDDDQNNKGMQNNDSLLRKLIEVENLNISLNSK
eukprot:gene5914-7544_t